MERRCYSIRNGMWVPTILRLRNPQFIQKNTEWRVQSFEQPFA